jgi:hypothetical protein
MGGVIVLLKRVMSIPLAKQFLVLGFLIGFVVGAAAMQALNIHIGLLPAP